MLRTPVAHSPNQSTGHGIPEHEVTRVKVTNSGASTPTLAIRGDPARMSLASKRSEFDDEFLNKVDFQHEVDRGGDVRASAGNGNMIGHLRESNGGGALSEKEAFFSRTSRTTYGNNNNG